MAKHRHSRPASIAPPAPPQPSTAIDAPETIEVAAGTFKNTCLALMDEVRDGRKQVVITKYGEAVARLVSPGTGAPSGFGYLRGALLAQDDIVSPDHDAWGEPG